MKLTTTISLCALLSVVMATSFAAEPPVSQTSSKETEKLPATEDVKKTVQESVRGSTAENATQRAKQHGVPHDSEKPIMVNLTFDAVRIGDVIFLFGALLDFDYEKNAGLIGNVTLRLDKEMTGKEVWALFDGILAKNGIKYEDRHGTLIFTQKAEKAKQEEK